jgi:hypothetical protein
MAPVSGIEPLTCRLQDDFYLKAEDRADKTLLIYTEAAKKLTGCQDVEDWSSVTRSVVRSHMAYLNENHSRVPQAVRAVQRQ